jgi:hypothetical protein
MSVILFQHFCFSILKKEWIQPSALPYSDDPKQVGDPVVLTGWGNFSSTRNLLGLILFKNNNCTETIKIAQLRAD